MELLFSVFSYYIIDRSINNQTGGARNKVKHDIEKKTFYLELNALESLKILYKWRHQWSNGRFTPNNEGVKINNWKQYSKKSIQSIKVIFALIYQGFAIKFLPFLGDVISGAALEGWVIPMKESIKWQVLKINNW